MSGSDSMVGQTISHYKILEKLGEGGMGVVYKGEDLKLKRSVALKFLPHHLIATPEEKARFLQEAQAAATLNHPNVCTIHAIEEFETQQFIVMEFVEGTTLREKIQKTAMKVDDALTYAIQVGEALQEAHSKGIVHRDVKAENVMITKKNQVKVMDFGLAKLKGSVKLTRTSSTVGTLAYMSPEQIQGGEADSRSDIFSFGVVLYEMLTGELPFRGEHEAAMMYSIVNEEAPSIQTRVPNISSEIFRIVGKALEKDPADRFQTAADLVVDLRRAKKQTSRVLRSATITAGTQPLQSPDQVEETAERGSPTVVLRAKKPYLIAILSFAMILVLVVLGYFLMFMPTEPTPFQTLKLTPVTSTGKTKNAIISPDGRHIVYVEEERGLQSLFVRQVGTGSNVQILPPSDVRYSDLAFSRDGDYIYFSSSRIDEPVRTLYRMPVLGGLQTKILQDLNGRISFSPDGKQFTFQRVLSGTGDFAIFIAKADGTDERKLTSFRVQKWFLANPSWSPDGKHIAAGIGSLEGGIHHELVEVDVSTGADRPIGNYKWAFSHLPFRIEWMPDGKSLIVDGAEKGSTANDLWHVSYPDGTIRRITNDLNTYLSISLTRDGKSLCAVQSENRFHLYLVPGANTDRAVKLTTGRDDGMQGVTVAPSETIIYTSTASGTPDLWAMDVDGSNKRQLTADRDIEWTPSASSDGKWIVYSSLVQSGIPNIWKIGIDGSRPMRVTQDAEDYAPSVTPDGKGVIFSSWETGPITIMRTGIDGGERTHLTMKYSYSPQVSSDGKGIVYIHPDSSRNNTPMVEMIPIEGGAATVLFDLPPTASELIASRPGTKEVSYIDTRQGVSNIWSRSIDGGPPRQITHFTTDVIAYFAWTPDGKSLVLSRGSATSDVVLIKDVGQEK